MITDQNKAGCHEQDIRRKRLTREGQATPLVVTVSTRADDATKQHFAVGDVTLAPLAAGEYVLELSLTKNGKTDSVSYGFRVIP